MQQHFMADRDIAADQRWQIVVAMDDRTVLDIAAIANNDALIVGAQYGIEPDAALLAEAHVANQLGPRRNVKAAADHRNPHRAKRVVHAGASTRVRTTAPSMHHGACREMSTAISSG